MFKSVSNVVTPQQFTGESQTIAEADVKRVFMVMHGYYGNLFFTKFATGVMVDVQGLPDAGGRARQEDQGIANARKIWAHGLRPFDADTIKTALRQCQEKHVEFPPSLPQFLDLCRASAPRNTPPPPVKVGMSGTLRRKYAEETRERNRQHMQRAREAALGFIKLPESLAGLKQAIAGAAASAGADEAAELLRLDRMLAPVGGPQ